MGTRGRHRFPCFSFSFSFFIFNSILSTIYNNENQLFSTCSLQTSFYKMLMSMYPSFDTLQIKMKLFNSVEDDVFLSFRSPTAYG
ncbi:hypothetical protein HanIR_Chr12g0590381 [Helianthus annuus]|nr:hypothetical protein HanIR_Chr12g0590381 [Helianthus annuus]